MQNVSAQSSSLPRMDQLRPELDNVLQSLSLNGYSIFSLINEILPRRNWEDERIKLLREDLERDTADICARLLSHLTSGPERVTKFGRVQCACSALSSNVWATMSTELRVQSRITAT